MIIVLQHAKEEGPGTLYDFFRKCGKKIKIIKLYKKKPLPHRLEDIEAVIAMGGPMNVYEEKKHPFLKKEDIFLKKALKDNIPTLGICLGAQLLAKALNAKVSKAERGETGWDRVNLTSIGKKDPFFKGLQNTIDVFQWHEDTFSLPRNALLLARGRHCNNQAFRYGKNCYALQFHIEVNNELISAWTSGLAQSTQHTNRKKAQGIRLGYHNKRKAYTKQAKKMYRNFFKLMRVSI